jgi:hypothetical protein
MCSRISNLAVKMFLLVHTMYVCTVGTYAAYVTVCFRLLSTRTVIFPHYEYIQSVQHCMQLFPGLRRGDVQEYPSKKVHIGEHTGSKKAREIDDEHAQY